MIVRGALVVLAFWLSVARAVSWWLPGAAFAQLELVGRGGVLPELCLPGVELDAADRPVRVAGGGGQRDRRPLRKARPVGRLAKPPSAGCYPAVVGL